MSWVMATASCKKGTVQLVVTKVITILLLLQLATVVKSQRNDDYEDTRHLYHDGSSLEEEKDVCTSATGCPESAHDMNLFRLEGHKEGHVQVVELQDNKNHIIKTVSMKPLIFEVEDFFTEEECNHVIQLAEKQGLQSSSTHNQEQSNPSMRLLDLDGDQRLSLTEMRRTIEDGFDIYLVERDLRKLYTDLAMDGNEDEFISREEMQNVSPYEFKGYLDDLIAKEPEKKSRFSSQAWIYPDKISDPLIDSFQQRIRRLTQLPDMMIDSHSFIQVVRYAADGHYNAHHDSGDDFQYPCCHMVEHKRCNICRYATIMVYLNDVEEGGETAFPVANNETYDEEVFRDSGKRNLNHYCQAANLKLLPRKGTAVLWYNHFVNETTGWMGAVDKLTWHGGCPVVRGNKWIMNRWIAATPERDQDIKINKVEV
ncbi:transmembrane prolyl 4-hydroxylase-like [Apostichopus japonicus]|uniref:transmembrane prolyl 4-hydroxylase-like n=1 Tax=Stichopus japonicus TaxID=307972 RepID=UPI003AB28926